MFRESSSFSLKSKTTVNLLDNAFLYRAALNTVKFRKVSLTPPSYMSNTTLEMATVQCHNEPSVGVSGVQRGEWRPL